ncbi:MAG: NAD-dependent epimerase/dehydratase family protein, partial [Chloroflexi bacterium]|nr:NAD-dependent epimerase/dehydratase family protein [Chloroflexota bacterium]
IEIMPLPEWISLYERMAGYLKPAPVVGIAINGHDLDEASAREWAGRITAETGLPAVDPVKFGGEPLVEAILAATGKAAPARAARGG